jgi:hypothetical protein
MPEVAIDKTLVMRPEYRAGAKVPLRDPGQYAGDRQPGVRDACRTAKKNNDHEEDAYIRRHPVVVRRRNAVSTGAALE